MTKYDRKSRENWSPFSLRCEQPSDYIPLQREAHPLSNYLHAKLCYLLEAEKKCFSRSTFILRPPQYDSINWKNVAKNTSVFRIGFFMWGNIKILRPSKTCFEWVWMGTEWENWSSVHGLMKEPFDFNESSNFTINDIDDITKVSTSIITTITIKSMIMSMLVTKQEKCVRRDWERQR